MDKFDFRVLQDEQKPWIEHNFKGRRATHPCLGVVEEFGELMLANTHEDYNDALGDIIIYMADLCSALDIELQWVWDHKTHKAYDEQEILIWLGKLCHGVLKREQGIRAKENHILTAVTALQNLLGIIEARNPPLDIMKITEETWNKVKTRDWTKKNATY